MKAIGFRSSLPINESDSFIAFDIPVPSPQGRDLLIKIQAISVNPVDYKIRQNSLKNKIQDTPKVIGWDSVGTVEAVGENCSLFKAGDLVFYAGDITRDGCNQEYQLVDERIVGYAPKSIDAAAAAAMPLTALTAYEIFFDRLRLSKDADQGKSVLIIGGAGGVGSIAIQLAKKLLGLTVIATASREESADWCRKMGADFVVNHNDLVYNVKQAGFETVDVILDFVDLNQYWDAIVGLIAPQGQVSSISDPAQPVNIRQLKGKSVSFHWELMFTRAMFQTNDMQRQHDILNHIAQLIDNGELTSTLTHSLSGLSVENLKAAHKQLESGSTIGKLVITY